MRPSLGFQNLCPFLRSSMISARLVLVRVLSKESCDLSSTRSIMCLKPRLTGQNSCVGYVWASNTLGASTASYISKSDISLAGLANRHVPDFPLLVRTKPALESLDNILRTKLGQALMLPAAMSDEVKSTFAPYPSTAMMCIAIEN